MLGNRVIFILAIWALLAASSVLGDSVTRVNKGGSPALDTESEAGTGDVVFSEFERSEVEFAKLKSDMRVSHSGKILPKGLILEASMEIGSGRKEYCKGYDTALYCLQDRDTNGSFDKVQIVGGGRPLESVSGGYDLEYQPVEDLPAWRKELLYQGASVGVARFTFREYGGDWTTPKISQDLAYDLSSDGSTEIVYQGARIQILSATSNGVRYKVLSSFRSAGQDGRPEAGKEGSANSGVTRREMLNSSRCMALGDPALVACEAFHG